MRYPPPGPVRRMREGRKRMRTETEGPPEGVDPGEWALSQYRAWRAVTFGDESTPPLSSMDELMARMREEPPA